MPSSVSIFKNNQRGGTMYVVSFVIFIRTLLSASKSAQTRFYGTSTRHSSRYQGM
jgi:hypothetical protein